MEEENKEITEEMENYKNKYLYLLADFENHKKRIAKQLSDNETFKHEDLIIKLLDVLDNCQRSLQFNDIAAPIYKQIISILTEDGLEQLKVSIGDNFDADIMNAVTSIDGGETNTVADIIKYGYSYKGKIIRYTDVVTYR